MILIAALFILLVLMVISALQSPEFKVSREIVIAAKPEAIFPYINNAKKSYEWMPWAESDPQVVIQYSGPEAGVGAASSWTGKKMGVGKSRVIESVTNQGVRTSLEYTKPFAMQQIADITLTPATNGTLVKWSVGGQQIFLFRLMGIFMSCDKMIGGEFEKGLKKLKALVEKK